MTDIEAEPIAVGRRTGPGGRLLQLRRAAAPQRRSQASKPAADAEHAETAARRTTPGLRRCLLRPRRCPRHSRMARPKRHTRSPASLLRTPVTAPTHQPRQALRPHGGQGSGRVRRPHRRTLRCRPSLPAAREAAVAHAHVLAAESRCRRNPQGYTPGRAGHHRHQRQDHRHLAHRPAGRAQRQDRRRRRQHRPDAAGHPECAHRRRHPARGLGARAVELPARRRAGLRADRGHRAEPVAGPPRLAWRHGRLRRGQGARLRPQGPAGPEPRRRCRHAHAARAGAREAATPATSQLHQLRRRHAAAPGRLRHRACERHGLAGARAGGRSKRRSASVVRRRRKRSSCSACCRPTPCASADNTTRSMRWRRSHWPARQVARSGPCSTACANTAASRIASSRSPSSTRSSTSTTARAPTWAPRSPRSLGSVWTGAWWSSSAARARARTSRRWPRRCANMRALSCSSAATRPSSRAGAGQHRRARWCMPPRW